jgi:hypothetical protein
VNRCKTIGPIVLQVRDPKSVARAGAGLQLPMRAA